MKYQQVPLRRLSSAGSRLDADGGWHPLTGAARTFYRVAGKSVQRVVLEPLEDERALARIERLRPLPSRALRTGFREEITLRIDDDRDVLAGVLIRAFMGWDLLAHAAARVGVQLHHFGGNTLEAVISLEEWSTSGLVRALALAKALSTVSAALAEDSMHGIPHTEAEVAGLLRCAHSVILEDVAEALEEPAQPAPPPPPAPHGGFTQPSLFTDD